LQRGLVPAIKYSGGSLHDEIITESAIVAQFLCDSKPSHLLPASNSSTEAALFRARLNFFVDTWNTKVGSYMFSMFRAESNQEKEAKSKEWVAAVQKEIEPLLQSANPFFGGSQDLTLAEVCSSKRISVQRDIRVRD
jgi:glutathione S-transferase